MSFRRNNCSTVPKKRNFRKNREITERRQFDEQSQKLFEKVQLWHKLMMSQGIFLLEIGEDKLASMILQPPPQSLNDCKYTSQSFLNELEINESDLKSKFEGGIELPNFQNIEVKMEQNIFEELINVKEEQKPLMKQAVMQIEEPKSEEFEMKQEQDYYWNL